MPALILLACASDAGGVRLPRASLALTMRGGAVCARGLSMHTDILDSRTLERGSSEYILRDRKTPPNNGNEGQAAKRGVCQSPYMSHRFDRSLIEVSPTTTETCGKNLECKLCSALRRARERELFDPLPQLCSPLTPGVQLVNLSYTYDGRMLCVRLGNDWMRMFRHLLLIGDGFVITCNETANIGQCMTYPELAFANRGARGASVRGGLWIDFRTLGAARAVHLRCDSGHILGVEFADVSGHTIHSITATPLSDLDQLLAWVRLYQACSEPSRESSKAEKHDTAGGNDDMERVVSTDAILCILAACCERRLAVKATVLSSAVIQRNQFIPQSLEALGDWWFASDNIVGLHFRPSQFACAKIATQPNELAPRLLLYSRTNTDKPALVLDSSDTSQAVTWSELLHSNA
jgi:hypothetical protein